MKRRIEAWRILTAILLAWCAALAARADVTPVSGTLVLARGDRLEGRLIGVTKDHVVWRTRTFAEDLNIQWNHVASLSLNTTTGAAPEAPFRFVTVSNDIIHGKLLEMTPDFITVVSPRFGVCRLPLAVVLNFRRIDPQIDQRRIPRVSGVYRRALPPVLGRIRAYDPGTWELVVEDAEGEQQRIPLDDVTDVCLITGRIAVNQEAPAEVRYYDGECVRGAVVSLGPEGVVLSTPLRGEPITCPWEGMRELLQTEGEPLDAMPDVLHWVGGQLRGSLVPATLSDDPPSADAPLRSPLSWRIASDYPPVSIAADARVRIVRPWQHRDPASGEGEVGYDGYDVVYLRGGDVIPCRVEELRSDALHLDPLYGDPLSIDTSLLKAIEFGVESGAATTALDSPSWVVSESQRGTLMRSRDEWIFSGQASVRHPTIFRNRHVVFDVMVSPRARTVLALALLHDRQDDVPPPPVVMQQRQSLILYFTGSEVMVRGMDQRYIMRIVGFAQSLEPLKVNVRLTVNDGNLELFLDDQRVLVQRVGSPADLGTGLAVSVHAMAGGENSKELLKISNFRAVGQGPPLGALQIKRDVEEAMLTVPRMHKDHPPSHMLVGQNGDLLRGALRGLSGQQVHFESQGTTFQFPRKQLAGVVWLNPPAMDQPAAAETPAADRAPLANAPAGPQDDATSDPAGGERSGDVAVASHKTNVSDESAPADLGQYTARAVVGRGVSYVLRLDQFVDGKILGESPILGRFAVPLEDVRELHLGHDPSLDHSLAYANWRLQPAKQPDFSSTPGEADDPNAPLGLDSPLIGKEVKDVRIPLLGGDELQLASLAGKVVVLEFWASWCGPCIRGMPEVMEAIEEVGSDDVVLLAVNQQESLATIEQFLAARQWNLTVGLDPDGKIARQFQVEFLPQTVVLGRDGRIARLHVGSPPNLAGRLQEALMQVLE